MKNIINIYGAYIKRVIGFIKMNKFIFKDSSSFEYVQGIFMLPHTYPQCRKIFMEWIQKDKGMLEFIKLRKDITIDLEKFDKLPKGTLGKELYCLLHKGSYDKLNEKGSAPSKLNGSTDYAYAIRRIVLMHDIFHVLLNAKTDLHGETIVAAFTTAQIEHYYPATITLGAGLNSLCIQKQNNIHKCLEGLIEGFYLGKNTKQLFLVDWEEYWDKDIKVVRKELNIDLDASQRLLKTHFASHDNSVTLNSMVA